MQKIYLSLSFLFVAQAGFAQTNPALVFQTGPVITLPAGADPGALAPADFNGDGKGDVAVCQRGLNAVGVYLQTMAGTFPATPNGTYPAGTAPSGLVAANLSGNSSRLIYDLAALSGPSSRWTFLTNNGQGTFTALTTRFGGAYVSPSPYLTTAYINRDSYPDFAYTYNTSNLNEIDWVAFRGGNNFNGGDALPTGYEALNLTLADLNQDGMMDVVFPFPAQNKFRVVFAVPNYSPPTWYTNSTVYTTDYTGASTQPVHLAAGDVNGDSQPDLAVANAGSQDVAVWLNTSAFQFGSVAVYPLSAAPSLVQLADLNGDNRPELITITADNKLQLFRHTGTAGYGRYGTPVQLPTGSSPTLLQVADMDGDLVRDLVVGCPGDNTVRIYYNRSLAALASTAPLLAGVSVYPNPATDYLRVEADALRAPLQATLLDLVGRTVRVATLTLANRTLPVADLPRGAYVLRLADAASSQAVRITLQ